MSDAQAFNWKEYEEIIFKYFRGEYPNAKITPNAKVFGKFSKIEREIDIWIEAQAADMPFRIAVDAKHYKSKIDVKDVEQFLGLLRDVSADIGVMISPEGYSEAAINRAHYDDSRVILDILNFKQLAEYQSFGAIPFADNFGVLMPAPFGWIVDGRTTEQFLACSYPQGATFEDAVRAGEWMYVKISERREPAKTLDELLAKQLSFIEKLPEVEISFLPPVERHDNAVTLIRQIETTARKGLSEFTGFIEFETFHFFCVMYSPHKLAEKNLRNLRYVLRKALPLNVKYAKKEST